MEDMISQSSYINNLKLPHFLTFFTLIYIISHKIFQNWCPKLKYEACSCFLSLFHGTPSVILSIYGLIPMIITQNPKNPNLFVSKNTQFQALVLEFSSGYFTIDLLHYLVFKPNDVIFIAHHLATLFVLLTCRFIVECGCFPILVILVIAEVTSGCQNVWSLSRLRKHDCVFAREVYEFLVLKFYVFYSVVRGVFAPLFVVKMCVVYASGVADGVIPTWVWCSWLLLTVSGVLASLLWILNHWVVYFKEEMGKEQKLE
ncbi:hypothetical protein vseg_002127 [Gypsophila vaccaria]